jgi:hypothetical protein
VLCAEARLQELGAEYRAQSINNDLGPASTANIRAQWADLGPLSNFSLNTEDKKWRMKGVDYHGTSASAAAYYPLSSAFIGVTQLQAGGSALFPKSTLVQGLLYKAGDQGQWLWGAEIGQARFNDGSQLNTLKVGPTYYWAGANPGFVTYRYAEGSKVNNYGHTLDAQVNLTYQLKVGLSHMQGQGAYSVLVPNGNPVAALVKSQQTELRAIYDLSRDWSVQLKRGQTVVDDALNDVNVLRSQDTNIGLIKRF